MAPLTPTYSPTGGLPTAPAGHTTSLLRRMSGIAMMAQKSNVEGAPGGAHVQHYNTPVSHVKKTFAPEQEIRFAGIDDEDYNLEDGNSTDETELNGEDEDDDQMEVDDDAASRLREGVSTMKIASQPKVQPSPRGASEAQIKEHEDELNLQAGDEAMLVAEGKAQNLHSWADAMTKNNEAIAALEATGQWHIDELRLFKKLAMRGFEPIMHRCWHATFRTCPPILFTMNDNETFFNCNHASEYRAIRALEGLTGLGSRIRAQGVTKMRTELIMKREVELYLRWSAIDGDYKLKPFIPRLVVIAGNGHTKDAMGIVSDLTLKKMFRLAARHRTARCLPESQWLKDSTTGEISKYAPGDIPPIIYAFAMVDTTVVIVSLDSSAEDGRDPKVITTFDFKDSDKDVWNGFALGMVCVMIRNEIMKEATMKGWEKRPEIEDTTDL